MNSQPHQAKQRDAIGMPLFRHRSSKSEVGTNLMLNMAD
jgi:hypothetical protein